MANGLDQLTDEQLEQRLTQIDSQLATNEPGQVSPSEMSDEELESRLQAIDQELESSRAASPGEVAEAFGVGFGESATFGALPSLEAGLDVAVEQALQGLGKVGIGPSAVDEQLREQGFNIQEKERPFELRKQQAAQRQLGAIEKDPIAGTVGQVGGFLIPGAGGAKIAKGIGTLAKAGKLGERAQRLKRITDVARAGKAGAAGTIGIKATDLAVRSAGLAAEGAAQGALMTPLEGQAAGKPMTLEERVDNAIYGAQFGAMLPSAGKVFKRAWKGTKKLPGATISMFTGVPAKVAGEFVADPNSVKAAEKLGVDGVVDWIDDAVRPIKEDLENGIINKREAQARLKEVEDEVRNKFLTEGKVAQKTLKETQKRMLDAAERKELAMKGRLRAPGEMKEEIATAIDEFKAETFEVRDLALDKLVKEIPDGIDIHGIDSKVDSIIESMRLSDGTFPPKVRKIVEDLLELKAEYAEFGAAPRNGLDIKKAIEALDLEIDYFDVAGQFNSKYNLALKSLRRGLDEYIKDGSQGYREMMEQVSDRFRFLEKARKHFGKPDTRAAKLNNITSLKNAEAKATLELLGDQTKRPFRFRLEEFQGLRDELDSLGTRAGREEFERSLHEFADFDEARRYVENIKSMTAIDQKRFIKEQVENDAAFRRLQEAEDQLATARQAYDDIKAFDVRDPAKKVRELMISLGKGKKGSADVIRKEFNQLSRLTDKEFTDTINKMRIGQTFEQEFLRGSRNVNLWTAMGALSGSLLGGGMMGGAAGMGMAAPVGAFIDKFGPTVTRKVLEGIGNMPGLPTVKKIKQIGLPPEVERELVTQFQRAYLFKLNTDDVILVDSELIPMLRQEIKADKDLTNAERARMVKSLNERGELIKPHKYFGAKGETSPEELARERAKK